MNKLLCLCWQKSARGFAPLYSNVHYYQLFAFRHGVTSLRLLRVPEQNHSLGLKLPDVIRRLALKSGFFTFIRDSVIRLWKEAILNVAQQLGGKENEKKMIIFPNNRSRKTSLVSRGRTCRSSVGPAWLVVVSDWLGVPDLACVSKGKKVKT